MKIEYDIAKAQANIQKHGVSFSEAEAVLLDPYALTKEDKDLRDEPRYITLGMGGAERVLVVVWTARGDACRIISAWKANLPQRRRYERQF